MAAADGNGPLASRMKPFVPCQCVRLIEDDPLSKRIQFLQGLEVKEFLVDCHLLLPPLAVMAVLALVVPPVVIVTPTLLSSSPSLA